MGRIKLIGDSIRFEAVRVQAVGAALGHAVNALPAFPEDLDDIFGIAFVTFGRVVNDRDPPMATVLATLEPFVTSGFAGDEMNDCFH